MKIEREKNLKKENQTKTPKSIVYRKGKLKATVSGDQRFQINKIHSYLIKKENSGQKKTNWIFMVQIVMRIVNKISRKKEICKVL